MLTAVLSASTNAYAYDFEVDGIYYNVNKINLTCEVTYGMNIYKGDIIIPKTVSIDGNTFSVTAIGADAFMGCAELQSITIPNSVVNVYDKAFNGCTGLKELIIEDGTQVLNLGEKSADEGEGLFFDCSLETVYLGRDLDYNPNSDFHEDFAPIGNQIYNYTLKRVVISDFVTKIGYQLFRNCASLTYVLFGKNVSVIDDEAFIRCSNIASVTLPNSLIKIGEGAFSSCSGLASVTIPSSVTSIGDYAFWGCSGLTSVTIPNSVTSINDYAFSGCSELTSVTIPNSVTSIGNYAFSGCSELTSVTIPNSVTSIGDYAFQYCSGLTSVTIPNSVTSINDGVFNGCFGLTSVTIPNSVTDIGNFAFRYCTNLESITIPNSVTYIGYGAFHCYHPDWYVNGNDGSLSEFNSMNFIPPILGQDPYSPSDNCNNYPFFDTLYTNATLNIPIGSLEEYKSADGWKEFMNIKEVDFGGVDGVEEDAVSVSAKEGSIVVSGTDNAAIEVYNLSGQLVYSGTDNVINVPSKGIYIVRVSGQTFKVIL